MRVAVVVVALAGAACAPSSSTPAAEEVMGKRSTRAIAADGLVVTLRAGPSATSVILGVQNPTSTRKTFCDYHTPFEGLRNDIFEVKAGDGAPLAYRGMMAKRAPPDDDDFLDVAAGGTRESDPVDLAGGYALTSGTWTVRFSGNDISGLPPSPWLTIVVP